MSERLFSLANLIALAGWLLLICVPRKTWALQIVRVIPLLLSALYLVLLATHWGEATGSFSTLAGVASLFTNPWLLLAGWIHYLAFDLFVGMWEVSDAGERKIPHWLLIPILALTFFFGPVGLLSYSILRRTFTLKARTIVGGHEQSS